MEIGAGGQAPRVILAVGDPKRERELREHLTAGGLVVVERCLDGQSVADRAARYDADVALIASDLHRLSPAILTVIRGTNLPVVLLSDKVDQQKFAGLAHFISNRATPQEVLYALSEGVGLGATYADSPGTADLPTDEIQSDQTPDTGRLLAIVGGKGSPGVTTVAIGLAHSLAGLGRSVVLVDADLRGGNVVPYLDLDHSHGLLGLTGSRSSHTQGRVDEELQDGPGFRVLAGLERPEDHSSITREVLAGALEGLKGSGADVLVDLGQVVANTPPVAVESVLQQVDGVLLVCHADLIGAWNARCCQRYLVDRLNVPDGGVALVINRQASRGQYKASELAHAVGADVLGAIPENQRAAREAMSLQRPISAIRGSVARAMRDLAQELTELRAQRSVDPPKRGWRPRMRTALGRR